MRMEAALSIAIPRWMDNGVRYSEDNNLATTAFAHCVEREDSFYEIPFNPNSLCFTDENGTERHLKTFLNLGVKKKGSIYVLQCKDLDISTFTENDNDIVEIFIEELASLWDEYVLTPSPLSPDAEILKQKLITSFE